MASGQSDHLVELRRLWTLLIKFPSLELMDLPLPLLLWHKRLTMRIGSQITTLTVLPLSASRAVLPARSVLLLNRSFSEHDCWIGIVGWLSSFGALVWIKRCMGDPSCIMMGCGGGQRQTKAHICTLFTAPGSESQLSCEIPFSLDYGVEIPREVHQVVSLFRLWLKVF